MKHEPRELIDCPRCGAKPPIAHALSGVGFEGVRTCDKGCGTWKDDDVNKWRSLYAIAVANRPRKKSGFKNAIKTIKISSKTRIKQRSKEKESLSKKYTIVLGHKKQLQDRCTLCGILSDLDGHHPYGRVKENILRFILVCRPCHNQIHNYGSWAREVGLIVDSTLQDPIIHIAVKDL